MEMDHPAHEKPCELDSAYGLYAWHLCFNQAQHKRLRLQKALPRLRAERRPPPFASPSRNEHRCSSPGSDDNPYASFGATLARDEEKNLWSAPHDLTHTEADDDRILYNMIVVRNRLDKDSEEWQKLNYDIYTLRQTRREVRSRWKHILEELGFQKEADSLLSVTKLSVVNDSQNTAKAQEILLKLSEETNIFPASWELSERYLFVVDRLIALDAADEFFKIASITYPKRPISAQADSCSNEMQCLSASKP
ncbi:melanoregulin [Alligator sinensis]|uniref:Melanoregulin n=1 Tax=Alligator sinensis TaxID=38654 RepID=A0A1U7RTH5_ALLSI|nr:melanoregulin [Alligator sinensis]